MSYTHTYTVYVLILLLVWGIIYVLSPRVRRAMLWTGLAFAPAALISEAWHLGDYWLPVYMTELRIGPLFFGGFEDYVFGFALPGISAGVFEILTRGRKLPELPKMSLAAYARMFGLGLTGLTLIVVLTTFLHLKSMHAATLAIALTAGLVCALRPEVALRAVLTGLIFAAFFWFFYRCIMLPLYPGMIDAFWMPTGNCGIRLAGVPLEEVVWGFTTGLFSGPVYRVCTTLRKPSQG